MLIFLYIYLAAENIHLCTDHVNKDGLYIKIMMGNRSGAGLAWGRGPRVVGQPAPPHQLNSSQIPG